MYAELLASLQLLTALNGGHYEKLYTTYGAIASLYLFVALTGALEHSYLEEFTQRRMGTIGAHAPASLQHSGGKVICDMGQAFGYILPVYFLIRSCVVNYSSGGIRKQFLAFNLFFTAVVASLTLLNGEATLRLSYAILADLTMSLVAYQVMT